MNNPQNVNVDIENLKSEYEKQGFKCELCTHLPSEGWTSPEKGHKADEIYILLEGEMEIDLYGQTYYPSVGEVYRVPAYEPHALRITGNQASTFYWIYGY